MPRSDPLTSQDNPIDAHQDPVAIDRETGDQRWESIALGNLERYRAEQAAQGKRQQQ